MRTEFENEPILTFNEPAHVEALRAALAKVHAEAGREYGVVIDGERVFPGTTFESTNPNDPTEVLGRFAKADAAVLERAVASADRAFPAWSRTAPEARAGILMRAASIMRRRRFELNACLILEVGKTWGEADADTAEAIDFFEFYAREMLRLSERQPLTPWPNEDNNLYYIPMGVVAVIPPWNFANAILAGMTAAALVTGNTVVLKSASDAPLTGYKVVEIFEEAGLPKGALAYIPGSGGAIGDRLVQHPKTRIVAFTGSKEIGCRISELAGKVMPGQRWIKRSILEMGGKDTLIIDADCDVDAAVAAVTAGAFGFQGQKCSANSRTVVVRSRYDEVVEKLAAAAKGLRLGAGEDPATQMGAVINQKAEANILRYIDKAVAEGGRVVAGGRKRADLPGYVIEPTVIADVAPEATISLEEIFGPVNAVIQAADFDEALAIANNTEFGLTGGVFSRNREHLERARRDFHVGNLYFNRKITGAMVGVHPFGGFNMSGTDSKAGGRDYLQLFLQAKLVSEQV